ncbi:hypothetical protein PR048_031183 [Dryococelus australis]|uniref:SCP domain-containing protein n=1 Tax=Dryococelus australis TaxID=614101 RepID=A0ABQ9G4K7_9NEOP|nr:hypothetical protein PR048_031183 [Dryococelus australis]
MIETVKFSLIPMPTPKASHTQPERMGYAHVNGNRHAIPPLYSHLLCDERSAWKRLGRLSLQLELPSRAAGLEEINHDHGPSAEVLGQGPKPTHPLHTPPQGDKHSYRLYTEVSEAADLGVEAVAVLTTYQHSHIPTILVGHHVSLRYYLRHYLYALFTDNQIKTTKYSSEEFWAALNSEVLRANVDDIGMEWYRNERAGGKTGDPRENAANRGIGRARPHMPKNPQVTRRGLNPVCLGEGEHVQTWKYIPSIAINPLTSMQLSAPVKIHANRSFNEAILLSYEAGQLAHTVLTPPGERWSNRRLPLWQQTTKVQLISAYLHIRMYSLACRSLKSLLINYDPIAKSHHLLYEQYVDTVGPGRLFTPMPPFANPFRTPPNKPGRCAGPPPVVNHDSRQRISEPPRRPSKSLPNPHHSVCLLPLVAVCLKEGFSYLTWSLGIRHRRHGSNAIRLQTVLTCHKVIQAIKTVHTLEPWWLSGCSVRLGETGFNSRWVTPELPQAGIVMDDAACRRVFSGISGFPRSRILALLHSHAVHDEVSTFEINITNIPLPLLPFISTDALSDMRPVKLGNDGWKVVPYINKGSLYREQPLSYKSTCLATCAKKKKIFLTDARWPDSNFSGTQYTSSEPRPPSFCSNGESRGGRNPKRPQSTISIATTPASLAATDVSVVVRHTARERAEFSSVEETTEFTCSEYWDKAMAVGAPGGQAPCMLHASNVRENALLWAEQTSYTCYDVSYADAEKHYDGNTARHARKSDEALGVRVSVARNRSFAY